MFNMLIEGDIILLTHKTSDTHNQVVIQVLSDTNLTYFYIEGSDVVYTRGKYNPVKLDGKRIPKKYWDYTVLHRPNAPAILTQNELVILRDYRSRSVV